MDEQPEVRLQKKGDQIAVMGIFMLLVGYVLIFGYLYLESEISKVVKGRAENA